MGGQWGANEDGDVLMKSWGVFRQPVGPVNSSLTQTDTDCPAMQDTWRTSVDAIHTATSICCTLRPAVSLEEDEVGATVSLLVLWSTDYDLHMWGDAPNIECNYGTSFSARQSWGITRLVGEMRGSVGAGRVSGDRFRLGVLQVAQTVLAWVSQWPHGCESVSVCLCVSVGKGRRDRPVGNRCFVL